MHIVTQVRRKLSPAARGFTLIELLVVIAIIALLASIILVSLSSARSKGADSRILSDLNQTNDLIQANASGAGSTYGTSFTDAASNALNTTGKYGEYISDVAAQGSTLESASNGTTEYVIYAPTVETAGDTTGKVYMCVDSDQYSTTTTVTVNTGTGSPAVYSCGE